MLWLVFSLKIVAKAKAPTKIRISPFNYFITFFQ